MKQVAIVGIQGVPARYGGFETLVENIIGDNCSPEVHYTVFCSGKDCATRTETYKGVKLKYVSLFRANGVQSTLYDILSMVKCLRGYDAVVILGVSGCIFLPVFRLLYHKRLIVNIDGLEYKRAKWGRFAKWFLRTSEMMAIRNADIIIADNKAIQDYVIEKYHRTVELITYGGDHVFQEISEERINDVLNHYSLTPREYAISVCRIEPENNCHVVLEAFCKTDKRLIFIGNWQRSEYGKGLKDKYGDYTNITILDPIYDLEILYSLRVNAGQYIHGHSAGGTNPSLVEAMSLGVPIIAFDVVYNRETTQNKAFYFKNVEELILLFNKKKELLSMNAKSMKEIAEREYVWCKIARQYEACY